MSKNASVQERSVVELLEISGMILYIYRLLYKWQKMKVDAVQKTEVMHRKTINSDSRHQKIR